MRIGWMLVLACAACGGPAKVWEADGGGGQARARLTTDPDPLVVGGVEFELEVTDPAGAPLTGLDVEPELFQAGTAFEGAVPEVTEEGRGHYRIAGLAFPTAGSWELECHVVRLDLGLHDHVVFTLPVAAR
jgi:hypothetical protein